MEAPDKIYLAFDHGFVAQSSNVKEDINGNSVFLPQYIPIEYIRKDALLEWLDENMKKRSDECDESILSTGYYNAFWLVKEYINSL